MKNFPLLCILLFTCCENKTKPSRSHSLQQQSVDIENPKDGTLNVPQLNRIYITDSSGNTVEVIQSNRGSNTIEINNHKWVNGKQVK